MVQEAGEYMMAALQSACLTLACAAVNAEAEENSTIRLQALLNNVCGRGDWCMTMKQARLSIPAAMVRHARGTAVGAKRTPVSGRRAARCQALSLAEIPAVCRAGRMRLVVRQRSVVWY
eukprot:jgi/Chrzof1/1408/Cz10g06210.t1